MADEYDIGDFHTLSETKQFQLLSNERIIRIRILRVVQHDDSDDAPSSAYYAIPEALTHSSNLEMHGVGDTEDEALRDCLARIKGKSNDEIFPYNSTTIDMHAR